MTKQREDTTRQAEQLPFNIYISAASTPQDEALLDKLLTQLSMLRRVPHVSFWEKRTIPMGKDVQQAISSYIQQAHLVLFLLSPDFLNHDQNYQEMEEAMKQRELRGLIVIPVLLRPTAGWLQTPIGSLKALPRDGKALSSRPDRESAMKEIAEQLHTLVEKTRLAMFAAKQASPPPTQQQTVPEARSLDRETAADMIRRKREQHVFDVFLCYNAEDRLSVKKIAQQLKEQGILPWFDEWELRPGLPWQRALEEQIEHVASAAVFVGKNGVSPTWQRMEIETLIQEFVERNCPVIPVLLNDAPESHQKPKLPLFLKGMVWVNFHHSEPDPLQRLIRGITGQRPADDE